MSIIGIVLAVICYLLISAFSTEVDWLAAVGYGFISCFYLLALSIVGLIKSNKQIEKNN